MKLAIMQPYFFPYIGYFQLMSAVDKFVVYDDVNYINKGWINRNRILMGGQDLIFTIPLKKASQNKLIKDIELLEGTEWRIKLLRTIELNYKKAPFFKETMPLILTIVNYDTLVLTDLIYNSFFVLNRYLDIDTQLLPSSTIYNNRTLSGSDRIIDICLKEKASHYINPMGGQELYNRETFSKNNLNLSFIKCKPVLYKQFKAEFIPALSIVDVLMFNDKTTVKQYLEEYELI